MRKFTAQEAARFINECISYKPKWTIEAQALLNGEVHLHLHFYAPNSRNPTEEVKVACDLRTYPDIFYSAMDLAAWVFNAIKSTEVHEAKEWFVVNGKAIYDPHEEFDREPAPVWPTN